MEVNMGKNWGENNSPERLEEFLRRKLSSRGVIVAGLKFQAVPTRKGKVKVDAFRGKTWIASANVDRYGNIVYSMPGTAPKQGW